MQVTTSLFGSRLPKQMQRALLLYIACILLVLFFSKADSFGSSLKTADVLKRVLSYQSPLQATVTKIPRKIWQTWKVDPLAFEARDSERARTWTSINPGYRYEVLTDENDFDYVETHFGPNGLNRLDIVHMYRSLTAKIIKADLLRYLVMYIEGGTYADIDVEALRPIDTFIPFSFSERDVDLVVGVEIDEPTYANHTILGPKSQSFCQWTFMCKPRHPAMMRLINNVLDWLNDVARRQNVPVSEIVLNFDEVISGTGPSAFTTAILAEMIAQTGEAVNWDYFHNLTEPRRVGNVLVLTVAAFAAGQGHSNSGDHNSKAALVKHHYHASSWPTRHPRYSHPAYGMVEECNWERECVSSWDTNTTAFDTLTPEQQGKLIADKEAADKEKADKKEAEKQAAEKEEAEKKVAELRGACAQVLQSLASPTQAAESQAAPSQAAESHAASSQETMSQETPSQETLLQTAPSQETPLQAALSQEVDAHTGHTEARRGMIEEREKLQVEQR